MSILSFRKKVLGLPGAFSNQFRSARLGYPKIKEAFRLPTCTVAKDFRLQRTVFRFERKSVISRKYRNDKADAEIQQSPGRAFLERDWRRGAVDCWGDVLPCEQIKFCIVTEAHKVRSSWFWQKKIFAVFICRNHYSLRCLSVEIIFIFGNIFTLLFLSLLLCVFYSFSISIHPFISFWTKDIGKSVILR